MSHWHYRSWLFVCFFWKCYTHVLPIFQYEITDTDFSSFPYHVQQNKLFHASFIKCVGCVTDVYSGNNGTLCQVQTFIFTDYTKTSDTALMLRKKSMCNRNRVITSFTKFTIHSIHNKANGVFGMMCPQHTNNFSLKQYHQFMTPTSY